MFISKKGLHPVKTGLEAMPVMTVEISHEEEVAKEKKPTVKRVVSTKKNNDAVVEETPAEEIL